VNEDRGGVARQGDKGPCGPPKDFFENYSKVFKDLANLFILGSDFAEYFGTYGELQEQQSPKLTAYTVIE
jgi:hypothetical protein